MGLSLWLPAVRAAAWKTAGRISLVSVQMTGGFDNARERDGAVRESDDVDEV